MDTSRTLLTNRTSCHLPVYMSPEMQTVLILLNLINGTPRKNIKKRTCGHHSRCLLEHSTDGENRSITSVIMFSYILSTKLAGEPVFRVQYKLLQVFAK